MRQRVWVRGVLGLIVVACLGLAPGAVAQQNQAAREYARAFRGAERSVENGDHERAAELFARAADAASFIEDSGDRRATALAFLASSYMELERYDEANEAIEEATEIAESNYRRQAHPLVILCYKTLSELQAQQEDLDGMLETTDRWLTLVRDAEGVGSSSLLEPLTMRMSALLAAERTQEGLLAANEALGLIESGEVDDDWQEAWLRSRRAMALMMRMRYDTAAEEAELAQAMYAEMLGADHPLAIDAKCDLARAVGDAGRLTEAQALLESAVDEMAEADPQVLELLGETTADRPRLMLGMLMSQLGEHEVGVALIEGVLKQRDAEVSSSWARWLLARVYFHAGEFAASAEQMALALAEDPQDDFAEMWRYLALMQAGETETARTQLATYVAESRDADEIAGGDWSIHLVNFLLGEVAEEALLEQAQDADKVTQLERMCEAWFYIGQVHWINGETEAARAAFAASVETGVTHYIEYDASRLLLGE